MRLASGNESRPLSEGETSPPQPGDRAPPGAGEELLAESPLASYRVDRDGALLWANRAGRELLGQDAAEPMGGDLSRLLPDRQALDDVLARLQRGEGLRAHPARLTSKDGAARQALLDAAAFCPGGQLRHFHLHVRDVTDERRVETELRESQRALALLGDISRAFAEVSLDLPAIFATVTRKATELAGEAVAVRLVSEDGKLLGQPPDAAGPEIPSALPRILPPHTLTLPLRDRGRLIGRLEVSRATAPFSTFEQSLLREIADRAALAITTAQQHLDLQAQRQRLETVIRQMPSAVTIVDASGRILISNEQNDVIFRLGTGAASDPAGPPLYRGLHPDGRHIQRHEWPLWRSILTGEVVKGEEVRILRGDGTEGTIRINSAPVRDAEGKIVAGVVNYDDVTESKRAARALEDQRSLFHSLLSQVPAIINFLRGPDLVFEFAHPLTRRALGNREIAGKPLLEAIPEHRGQPFWDMLQSVLKTGEPCSGREILARFDRTNSGVLEDSYWNFTYLPVRSPSGAIEGVMTFDVDVTDQVLARRKVEAFASELQKVVAARDESLVLLDTILATAPIGLAFLDREQRYVRINRTQAEANGVPEDRTVGRTLGEVLSPALAAALADRVQRVLDSGEAFGPEEVSSPALDDPRTIRHWLVTYYPVRDTAGATTFVGTIVVDVTAQKHAASEREKLIDELSRTVRFSEMFVGILGHDLRNPLSAITTAASTIERRADNEKVASRAARILNSANRMGRMIDQILDFTRIRLGQGLPLYRKQVDLREICRLVIDEFEGGTSAEVTIETRAETVGVWDPDRLSQMISNLLGNAIEHGKATPVRICIDGSAADSVVLEVKNRGCVPPELVPLIFEPFRSAKDKKQEGSSGLGLGLFITQQIVWAHAGSIDLHSSEAEGTSFLVRLPRNHETD